MENKVGIREEPRPQAGKPPFNIVGWSGFIVTVGILLHQIYTFGVSVFTVHLPGLLDGRTPGVLLSADPGYGPLYRITYALVVLAAFFFLVYPLVTLPFVCLRKKAALKLLTAFAAAALANNAVVNLLLSSLLGWNTPQYLIECSAYIAVNILMIVFYRKSKGFRALFTR